MSEILIVEDDRLDVEAFRRAVARVGASESLSLSLASNGQEAIDYLHSHDLPKVILVDLNMPIMNGFEFLAWLREHEEFSNSAVFVLTSSASERDLEEAYKYKIAGYLLKGSDFSELTEIADMLERFVKVVEFPRAG